MTEHRAQLLVVSETVPVTACAASLEERFAVTTVSYRTAVTIRGAWDVVLAVAPPLKEGLQVLVNLSAPMVVLDAPGPDRPVWEEAGATVMEAGVEEDVLHGTLQGARYGPELIDPLTGLLNRRGFLAAIRAVSAGIRRSIVQQAVIILFDLDEFTLINDSLGHAEGDALLVSLAGRLQSGLRRSDRLARVGADEFAVLLIGQGSVDSADRIADRLSERLQRPILVAGQEIYPSASVGIATTSGCGSPPDSLLRAADTAVRRAKRIGRGGRVVYLSKMREEARDRLHLEVDIRQAIRRDEFVFYYQPVVQAGSGEIRCLEALVRWPHPIRGLISPAQFLPLAEETGLILPMSWQLLERACHEAVQWSGAPAPAVSINLAASQLISPELLPRLRSALDSSGLAPSRLKLEITESCLLDHSRLPARLFETLAAMGLEVLLDDFGTGYCSLSYLERYPLQGLKIDRSFTSQVVDDVRCRAITNRIIELGRDLQMTVIAEGVETAAELECLRGLRCDLMQGYYFARPMPYAEVAPLLGRVALRSA
jgi:diguanylate cyclase (GGDEF)-like protein